MKRIVMLLVALALTGAAAAAGGSASAIAHANVTLYSGFPGSGGSELVTMNAQAVNRASAKQAIGEADSAVIDVGGDQYTFAMARSASAQPVVAVEGEASGKARGTATIDAVVTDLAQAEAGQEALAVVSRSEGSGRVVVALYHPQGSNAGLRVQSASHVTVWVNGNSHDYAVAARTPNGPVSGLEVVTNGGGTESLSDAIAGLQNKAATGGAGS
ncbi:MAG TPA: hypothetical protein VKB31_01085 [Trueperaceae bacterium]|nr:hypothetical protein [Trueperaceae bacterium]